jgi:flavorubredoxin
MGKNFCFSLMFMDIQRVKILFSLDLNTQFLTNNTQNVECCQKYLQILQIYFDIILASLDYLHSSKRPVVATLIAAI